LLGYDCVCLFVKNVFFNFAEIEEYGRFRAALYLASFIRFLPFLLWSVSRIGVPSDFGFFGGFFLLSLIRGSPNER